MHVRILALVQIGSVGGPPPERAQMMYDDLVLAVSLSWWYAEG